MTYYKYQNTASTDDIIYVFPYYDNIGRLRKTFGEGNNDIFYVNRESFNG